MTKISIVANNPLFDENEESDDSNDINDDKRTMISIDRQERAFLMFLDGGYSKDSWNVYFGGRKLDGTSAHSFQSLGSGYGKDSFFEGKKRIK
ncbi:unnamed protein product [Rotaria sp. Silwood1]|nr:unnamed protein product [Rotaria sp. Silwood1]